VEAEKETEGKDLEEVGCSFRQSEFLQLEKACSLERMHLPEAPKALEEAEKLSVE
jgi:hypothetical protein